MGQMSSGEDKEKYLRMAITEFGDCYYGSGVQVGAYARLYLAYYYKEIGKGNEAKTLFDEIADRFAITAQQPGEEIETRTARNDRRCDEEPDIDAQELFAQIGQLKVENEFLKKSFKKLGG